MHRRLRHCLSLCLGLLLAAVFAGCGDSSAVQYPVTGKVTLPGGASAAGCTVVFVSETSGAAGTGSVQADGTYAAKCQGAEGLPAGTYQVSISPPSQEMSEAEYATYMDASEADKKKMDAERADKEKIVPEKYRDAKTSGLTCEVKDGPQTFDITVE